MCISEAASKVLKHFSKFYLTTHFRQRILEDYTLFWVGIGSEGMTLPLFAFCIERNPFKCNRRNNQKTVLHETESIKFLIEHYFGKSFSRGS
jgi:hypothetical protein